MPVLVTKETFGGVFDNKQAHYLLGPRYRFHNHSRFTPFGEVLFGGGEASVSTSVADIPQSADGPPLDHQLLSPITSRSDSLLPEPRLR